MPERLGTCYVSSHILITFHHTANTNILDISHLFSVNRHEDNRSFMWCARSYRLDNSIVTEHGVKFDQLFDQIYQLFIWHMLMDSRGLVERSFNRWNEFDKLNCNFCNQIQSMRLLLFSFDMLLMQTWRHLYCVYHRWFYSYVNRTASCLCVYLISQIEFGMGFSSTAVLCAVLILHHLRYFIPELGKWLQTSHQRVGANTCIICYYLSRCPPRNNFDLLVACTDYAGMLRLGVCMHWT